MSTEIECARERLQVILSEMEGASSGGGNVSIDVSQEVHSLTRFLHDNGFNVATIRQGSQLVVEIEPFAAVKSARSSPSHYN
jgi:hypothetical protein